MVDTHSKVPIWIRMFANLLPSDMNQKIREPAPKFWFTILLQVPIWINDRVFEVHVTNLLIREMIGKPDRSEVPIWIKIFVPIWKSQPVIICYMHFKSPSEEPLYK